MTMEFALTVLAWVIAGYLGVCVIALIVWAFILRRLLKRF